MAKDKKEGQDISNPLFYLTLPDLNDSSYLNLDTLSILYIYLQVDMVPL